MSTKKEDDERRERRREGVRKIKERKRGEEVGGRGEYLAKAHLVSKNAVDTIVVESDHPIQTVNLVVAHLT